MIARSSRTAANRFASRRRLPVFVGERGSAAVVLPGPADVVHEMSTLPSRSSASAPSAATPSAVLTSAAMTSSEASVRHRPRRHQHPRAAGTQPVGDALADATGPPVISADRPENSSTIGHAASLAPATDTYFGSMVPELVASFSLCSSASGMFSGCSISA